MLINRRLLAALLVIGILTITGGLYRLWPSVMVNTPSTPHLAIGIIGNSRQLESLCPDGSTIRSRYLPLSAVYEGPVRYDATRGIRPVLLKEWRVAPDGRSVDLIFKKHIRFHNGKEMTAQDIKDCWERTLQRAASGEVVGLYTPIAGVDEFLRGQAKEIYGLQVISSNAIKVRFMNPQAFFISSLAHPGFWVYDSMDKTTWAPGTGPFTLKDIKNDLIIVDAYNHYHGDKAQISGIDFQIFTDGAQAIQAYREGKLNLVDEVEPAELKELIKDDNIARQIIRQPVMAVYGVALNMDKEPWRDNYLLRRALNYGIDRQALVSEIFAGGALACSGPLPCNLKLGKTGERGYNYNPELAKQLLAEAGYANGDGLSAITLYYLSDSGYRELAASVAEQLGTLGVEVYPRPLNEDSMLSELDSHRFESCLLGWQADYPEVYALFNTIYNHGITGYQNPKVAQLLTGIGGQPNNKQQEALIKIYKTITDDAPMLWLCQPQTVKLAQPIVSGLELNGLNQIDWGRVGFRSR